jgi:acyl carrier protein
MTMTRDEMAAMSRDEILLRLRALMHDRFEVDPARVQPATKLVEDLDLDSIDAIDMAVELQGWTGVPQRGGSPRRAVGRRCRLDDLDPPRQGGFGRAAAADRGAVVSRRTLRGRARRGLRTRLTG